MNAMTNASLLVLQAQEQKLATLYNKAEAAIKALTEVQEQLHSVFTDVRYARQCLEKELKP